MLTRILAIKVRYGRHVAVSNEQSIWDFQQVIFMAASASSLRDGDNDIDAGRRQSMSNVSGRHPFEYVKRGCILAEFRLPRGNVHGSTQNSNGWLCLGSYSLIMSISSSVEVRVRIDAV